MTASALAAVMTGPGKTEIRELPLPDPGKNGGLLRVDLCGVSEADPVLFRRGDLAPAILGHEIIGTIECAGTSASALWQAKEGDRVIMQEYLPCRACAWCAKGEYRLCSAAQIGAPGALRYGMTSVDVAPGLWGGFAQCLYLHPQSVLHLVPSRLSDTLASYALAVANGVQAVAFEGQISSGQAVLIFGCGLSGLAAARAASDAGAGTVLLCGPGREAARLALGKGFGADHVLIGDEEGLEEKIGDATLRGGADVIVDMTSDTSGRVAAAAIRTASIGARLVLGGIGQIPLNMGEIRRKYLTIKPVRGHSAHAVHRALELLQVHADIFGALTCPHFPLSKTSEAIHAGNSEVTPDILHVALRPWM